MEKLSTEYGKKPNLAFSIYPAPQVIFLFMEFCMAVKNYHRHKY